MKRTIFLLCVSCRNVFMTTNKMKGTKDLQCGHGCNGSLKEISKGEATQIFLEKKENEQQRF